MKEGGSLSANVIPCRLTQPSVSSSSFCESVLFSYLKRNKHWRYPYNRRQCYYNSKSENLKQEHGEVYFGEQSEFVFEIWLARFFLIFLVNRLGSWTTRAVIGSGNHLGQWRPNAGLWINIIIQVPIVIKRLQFVFDFKISKSKF